MRLPTHCSIHLSPYLKFKIYSLNIKVNLPQNLVCIEKHFFFFTANINKNHKKQTTRSGSANIHSIIQSELQIDYRLNQ